MQNNKRVARTQKQPQKSVFVPMLTCIFAGELITVACILINSVFMSAVDASENLIVVLSLISLGLGALVAGYLSALAFRKDKFIMSLVCGVILCIILVVINIIFFREPISSMSFIKYLIIIFCAVFGSVLVRPPKKKPTRRR